MSRRLAVGLLLLAWLGHGCSDDDGGRCGDGVIQPELGERCDGRVLAGWTCGDLGYRFGTLRCYPPGSENECQFDTSGCYNFKCGNGTIEEGEDCDGYNTGGATCQTLGFDGGFLRCHGPDSDTPCTFDTSDCKNSPFCGDQHADTEVGEECDGLDLAGQRCDTLGFVGGVLNCNQDCTFDTSNCIEPVCGNGVREADEACDGTDLAGETCVTQGFLEGDLACSDDCTAFDTSGCSGTPVCGNGIKEGLEACDGTDFGGRTCMDFGFLEGELACRADCSDFDTSACSGQTSCEPDVALGVLQPGVPTEVATDVQNLTDHTQTSCAGFGLVGPDLVVLLTLPEDGELTVAYDLGGQQMSFFNYALARVAAGDCDSDDIQCESLMEPTGTLSFPNLAAGSYFFILESLLPGASGEISLTFTFSVAEDCSNGTDDDGDGLADCEDVMDCCGDPACSSDPACHGFDGAPCTEDASCVGGLCLSEAADGFPGGVCSRTCTGPSDCAPGFECLTYQQTRDICYPTCPSGQSSECRSGYVCFDLGGVNICYPDCSQDADCPDTGACNVYSGFCQASQGLALDGEACQSGSNCESGICLDEANTGAPGGYCVSVCSGENPWCPGDGVCVDYLGTAADNWYCFDGCTDATECRTDYQCQSNPFNPPPTDNICWP